MACFAEGCKQTSEPPVLCPVCKMAGRLVCAQTDAGHGALIAISVLQDVLLTALLCWAAVNQLLSLCLQSSVEQDWEVHLDMFDLKVWKGLRVSECKFCHLCHVKHLYQAWI